MSDKTNIAQLVHDLLSRNKPLVIASIVEVRGSSPRHAGSRMVVDADGNCHGTIGGSLLEVEAAGLAAAIFVDHASRSLEFRMDHSSVHSNGMICGGQAEVLLDYVAPSHENLSHFRALSELIAGGRNHAELTLLAGPQERYLKVERGIACADGKILGSISLSPQEMEDVFARLSHSMLSKLVWADDRRLLIQPSIRVITLYCMGAGHVARPTAHLAAMTGFRVVVIDDRPELATAERFPLAARTAVIADYDRAFDGFHIDRHSFVAIFTRSHLTDRTVLEQALKTEAGYIGLMSSRRKRIFFLESLLQNGFSQQDIGRIHSPIGVNIRAETPEELAVSIVAELIDQRGILHSQHESGHCR